MGRTDFVAMLRDGWRHAASLLGMRFGHNNNLIPRGRRGRRLEGWLCLALLLAAPALADTPLPVIPKAKARPCVEEPAVMRRNHMEFLKHQRDDTMRLGIRTSRFSLKECISCHAVDGADGKPVTIKSERHFCNACHDYAAARIDCFQCHASTPEAP